MATLLPYFHQRKLNGSENKTKTIAFCYNIKKANFRAEERDLWQTIAILFKYNLSLSAAEQFALISLPLTITNEEANIMRSNVERTG